MGIVDEDIARVREATDFVAVVGEHVQLRRVGRRYTGLCPFHAEKSPSFSVNAEEALYYCFGCGAKGDAITFVRETQHLDFVGAVEYLAGKANISLRYDDGAAASAERRRRDALTDAMREAVDFYHRRLLTAPDAGTARAYLRARGLDGDTVRRFQIGWAPDDWDALCRALGRTEDVLSGAGLGFRNRRNRLQDVFRARVMFPIFDAAGNPVAFGGRNLPGADGPKYKNSSETALYRKSKVLYGLNWAKGDIVQAGEAVLCEGYTDVIGLVSAGIGQTVATCGTALTDEHFRTLQRFARRVVLCFDADAAGQSAAERVYEWERTHEVDIAVADLPPGVDPDELARSDPERLRAAIADARPFLGFRVERVLTAGDLRTPEGRARAAERALEVVAEHPSPLVRDQYLMIVADRCHLDPDRLRGQLEQGARRGGAGQSRPGRGGGRPPASPGRSPGRSSGGYDEGDPGPVDPEGSAVPGGGPPVVAPPKLDGPEAEALRLAAADPAQVPGLLADALFVDDRHVAALRALRQAGTVRGAIELLDPGAADVLERAAVQEPTAGVLDVRARLADVAAGRVLAELQQTARQSDEPLAYAEIIGWVKRTRELVRETTTRRDATDRLVAWLEDRAEETPE